MATLDADDIAALAAALSGTAPSAATSGPVVASIASPFAAPGAAKAEALWPADVRAIIAAHPGDAKAQRLNIAVLRLPEWSCSIDTEAAMTDGSTAPAALHGYNRPHKSGEPCNGVRGLAAGTSCPGTVR